MSGIDGVYIGDGVYVAAREHDWVLSTNRENGRHWIALGPGEIYSLIGAVVRSSPGIATSLYVALDEATA